MLKTKKVIYSLVCVGLFGLFGLFGPASAVTLRNPLEVDTFGALLAQIAEGVGILIASLGVIMIIVAGILYLTSAGSPEKIGVAKKALVYAIAGIAIGLAAGAIVEIVKQTLGIS